MISIVMPSYNRETYLAETIDSILNQTYKDWELIIVDDGSTDDSKCLYDYFTKKDPRIKVIYQENSGISVARNRGVREAKGEYIAVMDSDDLMGWDRLKKSLKAIKDVDFVYSAYALGDENSSPRQGVMPPKKVTFEDVKANGSWPHVTIMARKKCFMENPYRDDFRVNDDAWLVWQWFKAGYKAKRIDTPLVIVRTHPSSVSASRKKEIAKTQEIMDKAYEEWSK